MGHTSCGGDKPINTLNRRTCTDQGPTRKIWYKEHGGMHIKRIWDKDENPSCVIFQRSKDVHIVVMGLG